MLCRLTETVAEDYFDGFLTPQEKASFLEHIEECPECAQALASNDRYRELIKRIDSALHLPMPNAALARLRSSIKEVELQNHNPSRRVVGRVAAAFLVALALTGVIYKKIYPGAESISSDQGRLVAWSQVNMVITAPEDMRNTTLSLGLPKGLHVEGYEGRSELSLLADLMRGTNVLNLPIVIDGRFDASDIQPITAKIEYQGGSKDFSFKVRLHRKEVSELVVPAIQTTPMEI